jgi:transcriptional regulator with XRE-family HTH domain
MRYCDDVQKSALRSNLIRLREEKGWSQDLLAQKAELSTMAVVQIETGRRTRPRVDTLTKLASALGVTIDTLTGTRLVPAGKADPPGLSFAADLLAKIDSLKPARKQYVLALVFDDARYLELADLRQAFAAIRKSL